MMLYEASILTVCLGDAEGRAVCVSMRSKNQHAAVPDRKRA